MFKYLPSKKFVLILFSIILALIIAYIPIFLRKSPQIVLPIQNDQNKGLTASTSSDTSLKDRENALLEAQKNAEKNQTEFNKLTITEKVSREILLEYMGLKTAGSDLSDTDAKNIVSNALSYLPEKTFKIYSQKEIIISNSADNQTLRDYSNNVAKIILANINNETESVDDILAKTENIEEDANLDNEIKVIFQDFTPLITKNQQTISALLKVSVPKIFIAEHLNLINSFEEIYERLDLIQKSYNDMIIVVQQKGQYSASTQKLANSLLALTQKISNLKITFNKADYGYRLFNDIMSKN